MEKAYNISNLSFVSDFMIITINNQTIKLKLTDISEKLAKASEKERNDFKISPSGYGIHWQSLDEDLSINGMLKSSKKKHNLQQRV
jgi:Protein of unknown function (DUF2442)